MINHNTQGKWLITPGNTSSPDVRMFCFPYAGGNASTYLKWHELLPRNWELNIVQPPGRASRVFETPIDCPETMVKQICQQLEKKLDKPFLLFGHSMGSRIAFEVMCRFKQQNKPLPQVFVASASRGPHMPVMDEILHGLPEKEFVHQVTKLNGTPEAVLNNFELLQLLLPMLRSDFKVAETHVHETLESIDVPLIVLGGNQDELELADLLSWQQHFIEDANFQWVKGNHFYVDDLIVMQPVVKNLVDLTRKLLPADLPSVTSCEFESDKGVLSI